MSAKELRVEPIGRADANAIIKRLHYSHTYARNSALHFGVFYGGKLEGALQLGPSLDKRKLIGLVHGTRWHDFIEINRLALSHKLPRNSESRALAVTLRLLKRHYPQLQWVVSFADATQCGDGTIYRAAGFVLTGIRRNTTVWALPDGSRVTDSDWKSSPRARARIVSRVTMTKGAHVGERGGASTRGLRAMGAAPLVGYQLRYVYFLNPQARERLSVPVLPFSKIAEIGAGMYRGVRRQRASLVTHENAADHSRPLRSITTLEGVT